MAPPLADALRCRIIHRGGPLVARPQPGGVRLNWRFVGAAFLVAFLALAIGMLLYLFAAASTTT